MKLQVVFWSVAAFCLVCSSSRSNRRLERGHFADHEANKEDPGHNFHHKFGIVNDRVLESSDLVILPRPYVNPNKDKYKKSKKRPTARRLEEKSASESEDD